jgi:hypothetical protein
MNSLICDLWTAKGKAFAYSLILLFLTTCSVRADSKEYTVRTRSDGGYSIEVTVTKRHWITPDGFFPKNKYSYKIEIMGGGKDWSYRGQPGYFYSQKEVLCKGGGPWDFGYVWVDAKREYIYLNLFYVSAPDSTIPSDVNGKCRIPQQ